MINIRSLLPKGGSKGSFTLVDAVAGNAADPHFLRIASPAQKERIAPGHLVKLGFIFPAGEERLWAKVTAIAEDGTLTATLDSEPMFGARILKQSAELSFELKHVIDTNA